MDEFLRALLPRWLAIGPTFETHLFNGKSDLLRRLLPRLRAFRHWLPPTYRIIVLIDRNGEDCLLLKGALDNAADAAGFRTPRTGGTGWEVVNRIVVEELEAWYFGDWEAVRAAYPRVSPHVPTRSGYRDPDAIRGTWESFERIMQEHGYFEDGLRKVEAARAIGAHLDPQRCRSRSFRAFRDAIQSAVARCHPPEALPQDRRES